MKRAFKDMANPAVQREVWEKNLEISPELAAKITPIDYTNKLYGEPATPQMLSVWNRLATQHGLIPNGLDLNEAIVQP